jgi:hypothetical protein
MMKKFISLITICVVSLALISFSLLGTSKVTLLHKGKMINVSERAVQAHLNHGDAVMVFHEDEWMTELELAQRLAEEEAEREDLAALEKDYEEVGAESADVEGEEDVEE